MEYLYFACFDFHLYNCYNNIICKQGENNKIAKTCWRNDVYFVKYKHNINCESKKNQLIIEFFQDVCRLDTESTTNLKDYISSIIQSQHKICTFFKNLQKKKLNILYVLYSEIKRIQSQEGSTPATTHQESTTQYEHSSSQEEIVSDMHSEQANSETTTHITTPINNQDKLNNILNILGFVIDPENPQKVLIHI